MCRCLTVVKNNSRWFSSSKQLFNNIETTTEIVYCINQEDSDSSTSRWNSFLALKESQHWQEGRKKADDWGWSPNDMASIGWKNLNLLYCQDIEIASVKGSTLWWPEVNKSKQLLQAWLITHFWLKAAFHWMSFETPVHQMRKDQRVPPTHYTFLSRHHMIFMHWMYWILKNGEWKVTFTVA